jgi:hypothetical protein
MVIVHWNVPLLRVPVNGVVAVQDWLSFTKSNGGFGSMVLMLRVQVAVSTPAGESATPIVHTTGFAAAPTSIVFGLKSKLDSEGATMSSGDDVTASVVVDVVNKLLPA